MNFIQDIIAPIIISIGLIFFIIKFRNQWHSFKNKDLNLIRQKSDDEQSPESDKYIVDIHGPGNYAIDIVGESQYQWALSSICGGKSQQGHSKVVEAILFHEDDNPYDNQAIRVDIEGMTVGYLSKRLARDFRKRMEEVGHPGRIASCSALIVGGWFRSPDNEGHFGVKLDLPKASKKRRKDI